MKLPGYLFVTLLVFHAMIAPASASEERIIGSKNFTENILLAEIATQLLRAEGTRARHKSNLGGSRILWTALTNGEIAAYPEYTGTLGREILAGRQLKSDTDLRKALQELGIGMTGRIGFNNTYVLGMLESKAENLSIRAISDLRAHPGLVFAFSNEFMDRADGWAGLRSHYRLPQNQARGLDHDLAYRGLESGSIDAMDLYSTDAEIQYYQIRSLEDDENYFPDYYAVFLYRLDEAPALINSLHKMAGQIDNPAMVSMNAAVKLEGRSEAEVAAAFLADTFDIDAEVTESGLLDRFLENTWQHLLLVSISLSAAILLAIPLGVLAVRRPRLGQLILGVSGVLQTLCRTLYWTHSRYRTKPKENKQLSEKT